MKSCIANLSLLLLMLFTGMAQAGEPALVRMATTTSTDNSGLFDVIQPVFEHELDIRVHVIAVGTGKALELGRRGDVDVVLVHAPDAETRFVDSGFGVDRRPVMHNDFVLVGPADDPAGIAGTQGAYLPAFSPDGKQLASVSVDRTIRLWELAPAADEEAIDEADLPGRRLLETAYRRAEECLPHLEIERVTQGGKLSPGDQVVVANHLTLAHDAKIRVRRTAPTLDPWSTTP